MSQSVTSSTPCERSYWRCRGTPRRPGPRMRMSARWHSLQPALRRRSASGTKPARNWLASRPRTLGSLRAPGMSEGPLSP
eukprot:7166404-Alexandrium_andersonii.AAC.1